MTRRPVWPRGLGLDTTDTKRLDQVLGDSDLEELVAEAREECDTAGLDLVGVEIIGLCSRRTEEVSVVTSPVPSYARDDAVPTYNRIRRGPLLFDLTMGQNDHFDCMRHPTPCSIACEDGLAL